MVTKARLDIAAQDKTARAFNSVQNRMRTLSGGVSRLTGVLGGLVGAAGLGALVKTSLSAADALGKLSKQSGLSVTTIQKLRFAFEQGGVSQEEFNVGITAFTKRLGELRAGTGSLLGFLKKYDENLADALRTSKNSEEAFFLLAKRFGEIKSTADRAALGANAFTVGVGKKMGAALSEGAEGVRKLGAQLERAGDLMSEDMVRDAEAANDAINLLSRAIQSTLQSAIVKTIPFIKRFVTNLRSIAPDIPQLELQLSRLNAQLEAMESRRGSRLTPLFEPDLEKKIKGLEFRISLTKDRIALMKEEAKKAKPELDGVGDSAETGGTKFDKLNDSLKTTASRFESVRDKARDTYLVGDRVVSTYEDIGASSISIEQLERDVDNLLSTQRELWEGAEVGTKSMEEGFINVTETIQQRLQPVIADFYESLFGGKALNSVRDFLNSVKDMFIRIFAEIAAKITINKLFQGLFPSIGIGGVTGGITGGSIGGAIGGIIGGIGKGISGIGKGIAGLFGIGGAAGGATTFGITGGVGTGGAIAGTSLGIPGAFTTSGAGGGAAAPGLGISGALGPLLGFGALAGIHAFGKSRSIEEIWRDMWNKRVIPLIESGAVEAANVIDRNMKEAWDDESQTYEQIGKHWVFVTERAEEFAATVETVIPNAYAKVLANGGVMVKTTSEQQQQLVDDILDAWNGRLEPGILTTLATIDLASDRASQAMADGWVYASELAQLGIEGMGQVSSEVFARMVSAAANVAGEIGGIVGRAEAARRAVQSIPGSTTVPVLPGFQHGGSFTVGGRPGPDQNLVAFRATSGETVTITPPAGGRNTDTHILKQILSTLNQQRLDMARLAAR